MPRKIILDTDPGIDDALAIILALHSPELEVLGLTSVAGNVTVDQVTRNALAILDLLDADVPVAVGARKPLVADLRTATFVHGQNGLGNLDLPPPSRVPVAEDAAAFMTRIVRELPGEVTLVAVGPLTNVALAIARDESFIDNLGGLIVMGGAVHHPGNATPAAEANFYNDPEAAASVIASGVAVQLVDLGATHRAMLPLDAVPRVLDREASPPLTFASDLLSFYGAVYAAFGHRGIGMHDPLAVALAAKPDLATFVPVRLQVETSGLLTRGACVANFSGRVSRSERVDHHFDLAGLELAPFNASVAREVKVGPFLDTLLGRLEAPSR